MCTYFCIPSCIKISLPKRSATNGTKRVREASFKKYCSPRRPFQKILPSKRPVIRNNVYKYIEREREGDSARHTARNDPHYNSPCKNALFPTNLISKEPVSKNTAFQGARYQNSMYAALTSSTGSLANVCCLGGAAGVE